MSGVYIPCIRMPETCSECRDSGLKFAIDKLGLECPERKEIWGPTDAEIKRIRRADCPLVFVPEHDDLIDRKKLFQLVEHGRDNHAHTDGLAARHHKAEYNHFLFCISIAPTVIPEEMRLSDGEQTEGV